MVLVSRNGEHAAYRLQDEETQTAWVIERAPWHDARLCRAFENADRMAARLDPAFALVPRSLIRTRQGPVLVFADEPAQPVMLPAGEVLPLAAFLDIALGATAALAHVHQRSVLHRDIQPGHLRRASDGRIRLAGFGRATPLDLVDEAGTELPLGDDALPFAAPEAAHRVSPVTDQRSDLYSLGVTFYQLLTGRLPFNGQSPAGWLHAHLAMQPVRPTALRDLPPVLEDLILKLLAKDPADRYQSAALLQADLQRCRAEWAAYGTIPPFPLGQGAMPKLALSDQLFGRSGEIEALEGALERVSRTGRSEILLIAGAAGAGKSALAGSLSPHAGRQGWRFATGKSDQHQRDIPFAPVVQILRSLIEPLQSGSDEERAAARERLLAKLVGHGQLIVDLVPESDSLIGRPAPVAELPADLAQRRLNAAVLHALEAFAASGAPLVLFLDDLQWADDSTWSLIQAFVTQAPNHLLLLGAYRDSDHGRATEVHALRAAAATQRMGLSEILLRPLSTAEVTGMIAEATGSEEADVADLAATLHEKTSGNPFFIGQLLRSLVDERLFRFDWSYRRWEWDLADVVRLPSTDNVADLMLRRLDRLPREGRDILRILACIGPRCDEGLLAAVLDIGLDRVRQGAQPLKEAGLLSREPDVYAFAHDRVLEAAYALSGGSERAHLHRRIAMIMIDLWSDASQEMAFVIASQIERAAIDDIGAPQRIAFVTALLTATRRAQAAAAIGQASDNLALAQTILGPDSWSAHHVIAFEILFLQCECLILRTDLDQASDEIDRLHRHARSPVDRAKASRLRAALQTLRSDYEGAIGAVLSGLASLGIKLQRYPSPAEAAQAYEAVQRALKERPIAALVAMPVAQNPEIEAAMALLVSCQASFFVNDGISFLHLAKIVELTINHGPTPASAYGLSWFGVYVAHHYGAYQDGFAYAQAALALIERHGWEAARAATLVALDQVSVWTQPLPYGLASARQAAAAGRLSGDLGMECYAWNHIISNLLVMGEPLSRVIDEAQTGIGIVRQVGFRDIERLIGAQIGYAASLRDGYDRAAARDGDEFAELGRSTVSQPTLFWEWLYAGMTAFFFRDFERAAQYFAATEQLTWAIPAHINLVDYHLFAALTAACLADEHGSDVADRIAPHHAALKVWAALNPASFGHKQRLIEAEQARLHGDALGAMQCYEAAAAAAAASGFVHDQALAHERAARHGAALGLTLAARQHRRTAMECYRRWDAGAKAASLAVDFAASEDEIALPQPMHHGQTALDVAVWVEVARAVSEELLLDKLIDKLMTSMIVHAGAQYGVLLLMRGEMPMVEAIAGIAGQAITVDVTRQEPSADTITLGVLQTIIETKKAVVIDDAGWESRAAAAARSTRSVMGLPLIKQGHLIGVLYLENNLAPGVFTPNRRAMLEVIAPQAAISLEAARLYAELLDESNQRRQAEAALHHARADLARTAHLTAMGSLAASISHEINQPLTGIVSEAAAGVRWLRRPQPDIEEATANLEQIKHNGMRAAEIVRALRSLAKQSPIVFVEVRLDQVIREVLILTAAEIEANQVILETDLDSAACLVLADRVQLQQVVFNLVTNAVEAMGEVAASARRLTLSATTDESRIAVSVTDSGSGISTEVIERIFDPLFTTKESGMGMGLAICRTIMEAHGGTLHAKTTSGQGTTFVFTLPVVPAGPSITA
ncbi:MAG TPA: AAA family ATPase [Acidisoma sp.]|uniref:trifunctional serine/threonine-protein kinase/ATP-binding protein/sensor histidine kinase n=1 Tax=Acidisoma sp. TaxID=1872115 RepID=UPI002B8C99EB|nr:AAA family ATPase [Acidisoma sp.]HTI00297.1 AAA family ATPase [Acidisoma sp.]